MRISITKLIRMLGIALIPAGPLVYELAGADTDNFGTPPEARAMLQKAAAELKENKAKALEEFNKGEDGFKDRDLYVYCGGPDGNFTAHPTLLGKSLKDLKDENGKPLGANIYRVAQEGRISEVSYAWPRPGTKEAVYKVAYVTKVGDQVCAVGFYKLPLRSANYGTPTEAREMLLKAAAELKQNKAKALEMFNKREDGFGDRDLYVYCGGPDGNFTAHPTLLGQSLIDLKDKVGNPLGERIYSVAREGKISEVSYEWPRPGQTQPVYKVAYVTKVSDQVCAVGFYKD
jgi:signal transduction histidine kinase